MLTLWSGCVCFISVLTAVAVSGELRFASYYGNHMVLHKAPERAVIWGYGTNNTTVVVNLTGLSNRKTFRSAVRDGIWRVTLDPVKAGGPYNLSAVERGGSDGEVMLTDVMFGDVWLCGGQSNMVFTVHQIYNSSAELAMASKFPDVRLFHVAQETSLVELTDLPGIAVPWSVPTPQLLTQYSAVCWLFGRYLYQTLHYPIGLVESCWGGTPVEVWSSSRPLQNCGIPQATESYNDFIEDKPIPIQNSVMWNDFIGDEPIPTQNSVAWNAMIHPLLNMTITGAIWYQGENNRYYNRDKYNCTFPSMIDDWRMAFNQGSGGQTAPDFPFGFVQLCTERQDNVPDGFPEIRWHQTADFGYVPNERMKRTFMAVALDLNDADSPWGTIHPRFKQDVAYRLTLGARTIAYGEKGISYQGPFPGSVFVNETYLMLTYNQNVSATPAKDTFEVCCSMEKVQCSSGDRWIWMSAPMVPQGPSTVAISLWGCRAEHVASLRYAWKDWPCDFKACPVYSADGVLPAPPFVLHRWP
ncbi:sialate O-acetylesterase-like [Alosa sapidissima]|uniref:sialate O-acetylesterase-like n=1 Tax=Alosa sapidissima TaxID=34773 RepID=UPI001C094F9D|nr:sialate O-acetylesterase-like [Alosa sapidissima]XP_041918642.1 sialate O-acetylesterase-like [Alosa sapidissima]